MKNKLIFKREGFNRWWSACRLMGGVDSRTRDRYKYKSPSVIPQEVRNKYGLRDYREHSTDLFSVLGDGVDSYCTVPCEDFIK